LPKEKFRIDVMSAYRVTGAEAQDYALARNTRWVVTSLYFGPQSLTEKVEPSDAEVKEYFEEHRDEYAVKETRQVRYVAFGVSVSAQDSQAAAEAILRAHAQLVAGESFNLTMLDFSDLEADTSGALYARSRLDPGTDSIVKKLKPGTYSAPFLTTYGWQVVMLDSARTDSVALRRILVRVKGSGEALAAMRDSARVFAEKAVAGSFDTVALQYGLAVTPTRPMVGGELSLANMGIEGADQLLDWVRRAKPGSTFEKPLRGQQGFMVFGVGEVKPAGYQEFEKVKPGVSWKVRQAKEKALWMAKAGDALAQIRAGKSFEQYAQENPAVQLQTDSLAGSEDAQRRKGPEFAGVVQALAAGDKCGVLETNWGAFVLRCDERSEIQPPPVTAEAWTGQRQQQIGQQLMQTFLKEEGVKDYREGGY
jgi:parvulin-like peptidyl-prolyl isomerase